MKTTFFAPLRKVEDADDGSIMVTGIASTESADSTGETILASAIKKALPAYKKYPAIREMHRSTSAAGRAVEISVDDDGVTHLTAHIVDADAVRKVKSKVYGGFSVGGRVLKRDKNDRNIITEIELAEVSLVDRPAHPEAAITMWKIDAGDDLAKVMGERDNLAKQVAERDALLLRSAESVDRLVEAYERVVAQNTAFRQQIAGLEKRLTVPQPAPAVTAEARWSADVAKIEHSLTKMAEMAAELDAGSGEKTRSAVAALQADLPNIIADARTRAETAMTAALKQHFPIPETRSHHH